MRAASSASAGSRSPLTSLSIDRPGLERGARHLGLPRVDRDADALGREALDERHDARGLLVGAATRACR